MFGFDTSDIRKQKGKRGWHEIRTPKYKGQIMWVCCVNDCTYRCLSKVGNMQLIKLYKHKQKVSTCCTRNLLSDAAAALMHI